MCKPCIRTRSINAIILAVATSLLSLGMGGGSVEQKPERIATVRGSVVDQHGEVVPGLELWLVPAARNRPKYFAEDERFLRAPKTDAEGRFEVRAVATGTWLLGPARKAVLEKPLRSRFAPWGEVVQVEPGIELIEMDLQVDRGCYISGWLVDPSGEPVTSRSVEVDGFCVDGWGTMLVKSNPLGQFHLGPVVRRPHRIYTTFAFASTGDLTDAKPTWAEPGKPIELRLPRASKLSGRVVDAATQQPCSADVYLRLKDDTWHTPWGKLRVSPEGFSFSSIRADAYDLVAETPDGRFGFVPAIEVKEGEEKVGVEVAVEAGTKLHLRYEGDSPSAFYWIERRGIALVEGELTPGTKKVIPVPLGDLTIIFSDSTHDIERHHVEAVAGAEPKLVLP